MIGPDARGEEVVDEIVGYRLQTAQPLVAWQAQWDAGAGHDASDRLGQITAPTLVITGTRAMVQAGAGIVADSNPAAEFQETQDKARALVRALELAEEGL
jgi:pimeloyl-ACP methyl ester carboxylesterase